LPHILPPILKFKTKKMKTFPFLIVTCLIACSTFSLNAQKAELLSVLPQTKEEFIASEKNLLATIDWLENTPINEETELRKANNALFVAWVTNSPTVTIEISAKVLDFTKKNQELLVLFMAGWTRYSLLNNYSKDAVQGSIAGIRCAIKSYNLGGYKKDKEMQKLIDLDVNGGLEKWVADKLSGK